MADKELAKDITKTVRLSGEQWERVQAAAALESQRRGVTVYPTVLLVDIGMDGIAEILQAPQAQTA
jgi:hypothetical protein